MKDTKNQPITEEEFMKRETTRVEWGSCFASSTDLAYAVSEEYVICEVCNMPCYKKYLTHIPCGGLKIIK